MGYPATTHYLTMKLNWMARKLKKKNDPSSIIEWTNAIQSVFTTLEKFSRNKELTTPTQMIRTKWAYCKAQGINVNPSQTPTAATEMPMLKKRRIAVKGARSQQLRDDIEDFGGKARTTRLADKAVFSGEKILGKRTKRRGLHGG